MPVNTLYDACPYVTLTVVEKQRQLLRFEFLFEKNGLQHDAQQLQFVEIAAPTVITEPVKRLFGDVLYETYYGLRRDRNYNRHVYIFISVKKA